MVQLLRKGTERGSDSKGTTERTWPLLRDATGETPLEGARAQPPICSHVHVVYVTWGHLTRYHVVSTAVISYQIDFTLSDTGIEFARVNKVDLHTLEG